MGGTRWLAVIATIGMVVGCTTAPTASPMSSIVSGTLEPTAVAAATPAQTPTSAPAPPRPTIGSHWERADLTGGIASDVAGTFSGTWAAVGKDCEAAGCNGNAAAWTSPDGLAWTPATIVGGRGVMLTEAISNGNGLFALGNAEVGSGDAKRGQASIWASIDGAEWRRIGTLDLGRCREACSTAHRFAGSFYGFVIGRINYDPDGVHGAYRSPEGRDWKRVDPAVAAGPDADWFAVDAIAIDDYLILAGACVDECPARVWESRTGRAWTSIGQTGGDHVSRLSVTYDGLRVVVAQEECRDVCATTVWSAIEGEPFEQSAGVEVIDPRLAFTGVGFVLVGRSATGGPDRVLTAPDGVAWEDVDTDLALGTCGIGNLVGGPRVAFLLGDEDCPAVWVSRQPPEVEE